MRRTRTTLCLFAALSLTTAAGAQARLAWVASYDGPGSPIGGATAIATDAEGNAYVAAGGYVTLKYDPSGALLWERREPGLEGGVIGPQRPVLRLDGQSNVYLAGARWGGWPWERGTREDFLLVKYSAGGDPLWRRSADFSERGNPDSAYALAIDSAGNAYLAGEAWGGVGDPGIVWSFSSPDEGRDFLTVKYDPDGNLVWVRRHHAGGAFATDVEVDASGNAYVIGWSGTLSAEYVLVKYAAHGDFAWERRQTGPVVPLLLAAPMIELDPQGRVIVAGTAYNQSATWKYDEEGRQLWTRFWAQGDILSNTSAAALAIDGSGNVVVAGPADGEIGAVKYDPEGHQLWTQRFNLGAGPWDVDWPWTPFTQPTAMAIDPEASTFITGTRGSDALTVKLDPTGRVGWAALFDAPPGESLEPAAIAWSEDGVLVAGARYLPGTGEVAGGKEKLGHRGPARLALWKYAFTGEVRFQRGDATADGRLDLADPIRILQWLFAPHSEPECLSAADVNDDGSLDISDAVSLLGYYFLRNAEPPAPFPACGPDPSRDQLSCERYPPCWEEL